MTGTETSKWEYISLAGEEGCMGDNGIVVVAVSSLSEIGGWWGEDGRKDEEES